MPRPVNRCRISVPIGSEVSKKKYLNNQNVQRHGQLIGCISRFHSNKKEVFNEKKILSASAGQSVLIGSEVYKKKYIINQNLRRHGQLTGCISRFHSNKKEVFSGGKILGALAGQLVPYLGADRLRGVQKKYIMNQNLWCHGQLIPVP